MDDRKITIELPDTVEKRQKLFSILMQEGPISDSKTHLVRQLKETNIDHQKSRWAHAADRLRSEGYLNGMGEEIKKLNRDFRNGFNF